LPATVAYELARDGIDNTFRNQSERKAMHTTPEMTAGGKCLMAPAEKIHGSTNGGDGAPASDPSLADGTGEGNAPIDGTSASSDPEVLAGTSDKASAASLNDDDYPEDAPADKVAKD
jgi:hypothetical protein